MNHDHRRALARITALSAIAELATGLALLIAPGPVITALLTPASSDTSLAIGRITGLALMSLALVRWPGRASDGGAAVRVLLPYNLMVAAYLAYLGTAGGFGGMLLWPAAGAHALLAGLMTYFLVARRSAW